MNILEKYNQEQLERFYQDLNKTEQSKLQKEIENIDFEQINSLYINSKKDEIIELKEIEPIKYYIKKKLSKSIIEEYSNLAKEILRKNKLCVITMAGGQGSRLGVNGPKGMFKLNIDRKLKSLFEINCEKLIKANKQYNIEILWLIMTSKENDKQIKDFFNQHNYFDYPREFVKFFEQNNLPLITENKKLIIEQNKVIKEAADGNGGIFNSMYQKEIITDMEKKNIKWIFISSIDNILLKIADPVLLGLAELSNVEIATKSILRNSPEEKVGAICKKDNEIRVIEYSEMSDEMKNARNSNGELKYGESHIMCNLFSINALKTLADKKLPYHIAHKKAPYLNENGNLIKPEKPNAYKFETFIFDSWKYFNDIAILRGKREEDFAPVKNAEGVDSPKTAIELYNNYIQRRV